MVGIPKTNEEENLQQKPRERTLEQQSQPAVNVPQFDEKLSLESLAAKMSDVWSNEPALQLGATALHRKLVSRERISPPISEVVQSGVVPRFLVFLARDDCPPLQFEAAWALTNIASRTAEPVKTNIVLNVLPAFLRLLKSPIDYVREQAVWALGNIVDHSPLSRDLALRYGILENLLAQINERARSHMLQYGTWSLSKLCCGNPPPQFEQVRPMLPALTQLIHSADEEVVKHACWALSYLSEGRHIDIIQAVIEAGVCPRLLELLYHYEPSIVFPALRTYIIDQGVLLHLRKFLIINCGISIKMEACWIISNIMAGTSNQIQAVIMYGVVAPLISLFQTAEFCVMSEAAWAITKAISGGTHDQIKLLVREGCVSDLLRSSPDPTMVIACLEGLEYILAVGESMKNIEEGNKFCQMIENEGGLDKIRYLLKLDNKLIYDKAVDILSTYWMRI